MPKCGRNSDLSEVDHMLSRNITTRNAPYGTLDTPNVRVKIIGGKPVYVFDPKKDSNNGNPRSQSQAQSEVLAPLTEKPNEFNPNALTSSRHWGFSSAQQDNFNSHIHVKDNGDLNPHRVLPPIAGNVNSHKGSGDSRLNTQQNKQTPALLPRTPLKLSKKEELHLLDKLHIMLDRNQASYLKEAYKDMLNRDTTVSGFTDYEDLCRTLIKYKIFINPDTLRLVACMFVSSQHPGMVNYEKVITFLMGGMQGPYKTAPTTSPRKDERERRHPDLPHRKDPHDGMIMPRPQWGGVNLGMENELSPKGDNPFEHSPRQAYLSPREHKEQAMYFNPLTQSKHVPAGNQKFHLDGKLIRMVETQIQNSDFKSDNFEKLRIAFSKSDRQYRRTMSRHQIKKLCAEERLPLQESVIDQIIDRHCGGVGDGQHHWEPFIAFLERVQPLETGLRIPTSKKPREYAVKLPEPGPNWPLPEEPEEDEHPHHHPAVQSNTYGSRSPPRSRSPPQTYSSKNIVPISEDPVLNKYLNRVDSPPSNYYNNTTDPNDYIPQHSPRGEGLNQIQRNLQQKQEIEDIERRVDKLQSNYDYTKKQYMKEETEAWFDRFFKMAAALYREDASQKGVLEAKDVMRMVNEYNLVYDLRIPESEIVSALFQNKDSHDRITLEPFIKKLSFCDPN